MAFRPIPQPYRRSSSGRFRRNYFRALFTQPSEAARNLQPGYSWPPHLYQERFSVYRPLIGKSRNGRRLTAAPKTQTRQLRRRKKRHRVVPANPFAEVQPSKDGEHGERDAFLNNLQLISCELAVADSIGGHLETIFAERSQLTTMASTMGAERCFRCPYQATVMKAFERKSRTIVRMRDDKARLLG
jgi:hypothetical protein